MPSMFATRSLCKLGYPEELDEFLTKAKSNCGEGEDMEWLDVATEDGWTCLHDMITHECQFSKVLCCSLNSGFFLDISKKTQGQKKLKPKKNSSKFSKNSSKSFKNSIICQLNTDF